MKNRIIVVVSIILLLNSCMPEDQVYVQSPNGKIAVKIYPEDEGIFYQVYHNTSPLIHKAALGFVLSGGDTISGNLEVTEIKHNSKDETWEQIWGEKRLIRDNYNEIIVKLRENRDKKRQINIIFRAYNDGIGFRYEIPELDGVDSLIILDELTEFEFADNHQAWWIPAYRDNRYEYLYEKSYLNQLDTVHTPLTIETKNGVCMSIHQAGLEKYASMTLANVRKNTLKCDLVPWSDGIKVKTTAPMLTPWRTIQIGDSAGDLIESSLILNLNEPNRIENVSWIKPVKYMGIWWGMHIGKYTFWEDPKQGATTPNAKRYIDFAAKNGIENLLIEGWNKGWTPAWYESRLHEFSFTKCADGFDFDEVVKYAKSKGVNIIGYHETGSNIDNYLAQIDEGMKMYQDAEINNIKIGQVGSRLKLKEWHHGQYGVEYYRYVLEKAAEYQLNVNFHEPIIPTGLRRTFPNLMTGEGARGQEYNAWSEGNPPEHTCILPFTRLLAGPMDFTPGIFNIKTTRVHTTLAKQLALYVTSYSPVQMLADLPENYDGHPAFKFLLDVPVDWEDTKVINAKIGDFLTIVRKDKNSENWYLGSITDENAREMSIDLDFLDDGAQYSATIYADAPDAEFDKNPEVYKIEELLVAKGSDLNLKLAPGGGCAIQFVKN